MPEQQKEHLFVSLARELRQRGHSTWVLGETVPIKMELLLTPGERTGEKHLRGSVVTGSYHTATYSLTSAIIVPDDANLHDMASMIQQIVEELYHAIEANIQEAQMFRAMVRPVVRE